MTQEHKELLLKDLCERLPYEVKISVNNNIESLQGINVLDNIVEYGSFLSSGIEEVKPYLFPLSSMTEEQEEEYNDLNSYELGCFPHTEEALDYLIKNNFDYRGLIEEGLAIDATGLNIYWFMTTNDIEKVEIIPLYEIIKNQQEKQKNYDWTRNLWKTKRSAWL